MIPGLGVISPDQRRAVPGEREVDQGDRTGARGGLHPRGQRPVGEVGGEGEPGAGHAAAHPGVRRPPPLGRAVRRDAGGGVRGPVADRGAGRGGAGPGAPGSRDHEALAAKPTDDLRGLRFLSPRATTTSTGRHPRRGPHGGGDVHQGDRAGSRPSRSPSPDWPGRHIWQFHFSERTAARLARPGAPSTRPCALQPNSPEAHLALGQIHYWGELDYEAALREFRIAHAGDPGNGDMAWARGLVERRLGQWDQAIADLRRARGAGPAIGRQEPGPLRGASPAAGVRRGRARTWTGPWRWSRNRRSTSSRRC